MPPDSSRMRAATPEQQKALKLGEYYTVGAKGIIDSDADLEALARELAVSKPWEELKDQ